jgi:hypothetical protein
MGQDTHHTYGKQLSNIKQEQTREFRNTICDLLLSRPVPPSGVGTAPIVPRALGLLSNRMQTRKTAATNRSKRVDIDSRRAEGLDTRRA